MKILLVAPVHNYSVYAKQKDNRPFVIGQGQQSWYDALTVLGNEVSVFRYSDTVLYPQIAHTVFHNSLENLSPRIYSRMRRYNDIAHKLMPDNWARNAKLILMAKKIKPDLLIFSGGSSSIFSTTLATIKRKHACKLVLFSGINPLTSITPGEHVMIQDNVCDFIFTNDRSYERNWKKLGASHVYTLPISSVDRKLHNKIILNSTEKKEFGCDVCFVGSLTPERQKILSKLLNFDIKIWGTLPLKTHFFRRLNKVYKGEAHGEKMVKIFNACRIILNFQPTDMDYGGNMRMFEIPGCGAFQLADKIDPRWFVNGKEVVTFNSIQDLKKKILYYLKNSDKRKDIAQDGYERARQDHTYEEHFKKLFKIIKT